MLPKSFLPRMAKRADYAHLLDRNKIMRRFLTKHKGRSEPARRGKLGGEASRRRKRVSGIMRDGGPTTIKSSIYMGKPGKMSGNNS